MSESESAGEWLCRFLRGGHVIELRRQASRGDCAICIQRECPGHGPKRNGEQQQYSAQKGFCFRRTTHRDHALVMHDELPLTATLQPNMDVELHWLRAIPVLPCSAQ